MNRAAKSEPTADSRAVTNTAEAELLMKHLMDVMDALLRMIDQETELVRSGNLIGAASLEASKAELSRLYLVDASRLKASQDFLSRTMPDLFAALRQRHDLFHALLQMNLTVLATAMRCRKASCAAPRMSWRAAPRRRPMARPAAPPCRRRAACSRSP